MSLSTARAWCKEKWRKILPDAEVSLYRHVAYGLRVAIELLLQTEYALQLYQNPQYWKREVYDVTKRYNELPLPEYGTHCYYVFLFWWHSRVTLSFVAFSCSCAPGFHYSLLMQVSFQLRLNILHNLVVWVWDKMHRAKAWERARTSLP